jgi:hypothetical protein
MSTAARYFVTDEAAKAKNWDILQQYQSAKANVARLENEASAIGGAFAQVVEALREVKTSKYKVGDDVILVHNSNTPGNLQFRVDLTKLDPAKLASMLNDLETSRESVIELRRQLSALGVELS